MSKEITIRLTSEPEIETPEHAGKDCSPGYADAVYEMKKRAQGRWGWCSAKVEVTVKLGKDTFVGDAYLGHCSYLSAEDFAASGYLPQMIEEAIKEVVAKQEKILGRRITCAGEQIDRCAKLASHKSAIRL